MSDAGGYLTAVSDGEFPASRGSSDLVSECHLLDVSDVADGCDGDADLLDDSDAKGSVLTEYAGDTNGDRACDAEKPWVRVEFYRETDEWGTPVLRLRQLGEDATVTLDSTPCNFGGRRPWFPCPKCSDRVKKLYQPAGKGRGEWRFRCRERHGLPYESARYTPDGGDDDSLTPWGTAVLLEQAAFEWVQDTLGNGDPEKYREAMGVLYEARRQLDDVGEEQRTAWGVPSFRSAGVSGLS